ncbi:MAG: hypothetical protein ACJAYU_004849 [Bradymonadia bacterium]|jgi:hypothetical protein
MALTLPETAFVFALVSIMVAAFGWLLRRGARRTYLAERAELRMAAGKLGSLVSREFSHEPCVGCGGVDMDLTAIRDSGVSADFRCTDCGTEGSASASADASAKARKSWEQYSTLRKAFEKGHKSSDPGGVGVRFRVWVAKT